MRRLLTATFLVSAAAIGYEVLLMRVLSIVQWHHFAWMIISLALLGYGASGTCIAVLRPFVERHFELVYAASATLFSVSLVLSYVIGQRVPFNALEIIWDPGQFGLLLSLYLVYLVPFFFAAVCIGSALTVRTRCIARVYFADLLGAGVGAVTIIVSLWILDPDRTLLMLAVTALLAGTLMVPAVSMRRPVLLAQAAWVLLLLSGAIQPWLALQVSPFKGLSQALAVVDSAVIAETSSPLGLLTVVESPTVPFRHAPGMSLGATDIPPEQLGVFTDADSLSVITRYDGRISTHEYLGDLISALPYTLLASPSVLIVGGGTGGDVLQALYHGAGTVDVVELNPQMTRLVTQTFADFAGHLYDDARISLHTAEARGFVARSGARFDLVQIGLLDSVGAAGSGVHSLNESYTYTVEALGEYLEHTNAGGLVAIARWVKTPPRDTLKLFATSVAALKALGAPEPGNRLALLRSWNMSLLLIRNGDFEAGELRRIREFARSRSFDLAWLPGIEPNEVNRFNRLEQPWFYHGTSELLGEAGEEFIDRYKFRIEPATDDRPYYFHFFKWRTLPEILELRKRGGASLVEWGYLVLIGTLLQALIAGIALILVPLSCMRRTWAVSAGTRFGSYFLLLGVGFLFIEIAFIQKLILFLGHPLYAVAVVLSGFLVFAGIGSAASAGLKRVSRQPVTAAVAGIGLVSLVYLAILPAVFDAFMGAADVTRIAVALAIIAPLAFFMGMPFPLGLVRVSGSLPDFLPWAWGINGFASVVSAVLATILAIAFGFSVVVLAALLCYVLAAALIRTRVSA